MARAQQIRLHHAHVPDDRVQRGPELVRERCQELVLETAGIPRDRQEPLPFLLRSLAIADVPGDLGGADDGAVLRLDRRDRQRHRHERAVSAAADGLVVFDPFAASDAGQDLVFLLLPVVGDDATNGLADHLRFRKAEHPLGGRIPGGDDAVQILADDGIVARIDDRGEPLRIALHMLGAAQIADDLRGADDLPGRSPNRRDRQRDRHQRAVLSDSNGFEMIDELATPYGAEDLIFF
jgi:hypothetical protein